MKALSAALRLDSWLDTGRFLLIFFAYLGIIFESHIIFNESVSLFEVVFWQLLIAAVGIYFLYSKYPSPRRFNTESNLHKKIKYMETFHEVATRIGAESTVINQLKLISEALSRLMKTSRISIMLLRDDHLEIIEAIGIPDDIKRNTRIKVGEGIAGWVMERGTPLILNGVVRDNRFSNLIPKSTPIHSALCVPLKFQDQRLGILNISRDESADCFDDDDLHVVEMFASEVSVILHKEHLIEKLTEQMEKLKAAQFDLLHAEKLGDIGTLISGLSHELNNYLTPLKGYLQMMLEKAHDAEKVTHYSTILSEVVDNMSKLVSELLDLSRKKHPAYQEINLNDLAQRTLRLFQLRLRGTQVRVQTDLASNLEEIIADPGQIKQVILNLLNNAFQSFDNGQGTILLSTRKENRLIQLEVRDNGKGIPEQALSKIFQPFFTTKEKEGTGLGLKICKKIMESHQGKIEILSQPGKGTAVRLSFPEKCSTWNKVAV